MRCCAAQCSAAPREWRVEVIGDCHGAGRLAEQSHLAQGAGGGGGILGYKNSKTSFYFICLNFYTKRQ